MSRAGEPLEQVGGPNRGNLDGQLIQAGGYDSERWESVTSIASVWVSAGRR